MMRTKDEIADLLADAHFHLDHGISRIFRIVEPDEANPMRPVKLLEVNAATPEMGIQPVGMSAEPARDVPYSSIIVEISPNEFDQLMRAQLCLPHEWEIGRELFPDVSARRTAS